MAEYNRVAIRARCNGSEIINTLAFRARGGGNIDQTDLLARVEAWIVAVWTNAQSQSMVYQSIEARELGTGFPTVVGRPLAGITGDIGEGPTNNQLAAIIRLRSPFLNRRKNGRVYYGGMPASAVSGNRVAVDTLARLTLICTNTMTLFGPSGSEPYELGVWSQTAYDTGIGGGDRGWSGTVLMSPEVIMGAIKRRREGVGS